MGQNNSQDKEGERELMRRHKINKSELESLRKLFRERCGGKYKALTKTKFREVYNELFPGKSTQYADEMFRLFDMDGNGQVDFVEFVRNICMCDSDDIEEKIEIAFALYDKDNSKTITQAEVRNMLEAYTNMLGVPLEGGKTGAQIAKEFFAEMDADGDKSVTFDEFQHAARRNSAILSIVNPKPPNWGD
ncbi:visinin-like protein 1 [Saccostrea cucullata]|uniref:visinin-like protein 1 n=1 Tax=Saccostrea cuccullata TaxID=36930 RepID=UPI002ED0E209